MTTQHVDFEVIAVMNAMLLVRFRVNDKHFDMTVVWDGRGDVLDQIKSMARGVLMQIDQPPPPTFAQLQAQVGKLGHVDVEPLPRPGDPLPPPSPSPGMPKAG